MVKKMKGQTRLTISCTAYSTMVARLGTSLRMASHREMLISVYRMPQATGNSQLGGAKAGLTISP